MTGESEPGKMIGDIASGARAYIIRSGLWETAAICSPAVAQSVARISAPYFEVFEGLPGGVETWTVAAADAVTAPLHETLESVVPRGEVESSLAISPEKRVIYCLSPRDDAWMTRTCCDIRALYIGSRA